MDYLRSHLAGDPLPDKLRRLLPPKPDDAPSPVALTSDGFVLTGPEGQSRTIPLPPEMPPVHWPVAAVRDDAGGVLYGVTAAGGGSIYAYDETRQDWRQLGDMDRANARGLLLDPKGHRLITTLSRYADPFALASHDLRGPDRTLDPCRRSVEPSGADLPLRSRQRARSGSGALGIDGDKVLLVSTGPAFPRTGADLGPQRWRAYQVDLSTGSAELVGYEGGIAVE